MIHNIDDSEAYVEHDQPLWKHSEWFRGESDELCHIFIHQMHSNIGIHSNEFYELDIVLNGNARLFLENDTYSAPLGSIFLIHPGLRHGYKSVAECSILHVLITSEFLNMFDSVLSKMSGFTLLFEVEPYLKLQGRGNSPLCLSEADYKIISPLIGELLRLEQSTLSGKEILKNSGLLFLLCQLASFAKKNTRGPVIHSAKPYYYLIEGEMEYIRNHCGDNLSLAFLAEHANMSRSSYMRHFASISGVSPTQFLLQCRMAQARKLLLYSEKSITEIALECGFFDASHFAHTFFKLHGSTPSDYRILNAPDKPYYACSICSSHK